MIAVGEKPDFNFDITALVAGEEQTQPFASLLSKPTIITVYMRNNTSACDKQNASLAAGEAAITAKGYQIIAVSRDKCTSHAKYAQKLGIAYTLVADPEDRVATALDAVIEKSMYGKKYMGPARAAFLLDASGTVEAIIPKLNPKEHAEELLALIDSLHTTS